MKLDAALYEEVEVDEEATKQVIGVIASIWIIVAQVIAARQALDVSTGKAVVACIVSFIPYAIINVLIGVLALLF